MDRMSRSEGETMKIRNQVLGIAGAAVLLTSASLGAFATVAPNDTADVAVEITPVDGATVSVIIDESTSNPFEDKEYSLSQQTSLGDLDVTVTDNRGTAKGWTIGIHGTDFERSNSTVGADIPAGNLALSAGTVSSQPGSGADPSSVSVPSNLPTTIAQPWQAASNEGDGIYTLPLIGTLTIPAGTLVDTYQSTVTVEVTAAPN
jgi:hypothetical protein